MRGIPFGVLVPSPLDTADLFQMSTRQSTLCYCYRTFETYSSCTPLANHKWSISFASSFEFYLLNYLAVHSPFLLPTRFVDSLHLLTLLSPSAFILQTHAYCMYSVLSFFFLLVPPPPHAYIHAHLQDLSGQHRVEVVQHLPLGGVEKTSGDALSTPYIVHRNLRYLYNSKKDNFLLLR